MYWLLLNFFSNNKNFNYKKFIRNFQSEKNEENLNKLSKTINSQIKLPKILSFPELFCVKEFILDRKKRNFLKLSSDIIEKKLSLEYFLKFFSDFDKLKNIILNKEEQENFSKLPNSNIENHLKEIIILRKEYEAKNKNNYL